MNKEELEEKYRKAAYKNHHKSGVVEVDLCGEVSPDIGGPQGEVARGAYVQAWVWVPADAVEAPNWLSPGDEWVRGGKP